MHLSLVLISGIVRSLCSVNLTIIKLFMITSLNLSLSASTMLILVPNCFCLAGYFSSIIVLAVT